MSAEEEHKEGIWVWTLANKTRNPEDIQKFKTVDPGISHREYKKIKKIESLMKQSKEEQNVGAQQLRDQLKEQSK